MSAFGTGFHSDLIRVVSMCSSPQVRSHDDGQQVRGPCMLRSSRSDAFHSRRAGHCGKRPASEAVEPRWCRKTCGPWRGRSTRWARGGMWGVLGGLAAHARAGTLRPGALERLLRAGAQRGAARRGGDRWPQVAGALEDCALGLAVLLLNALPQAELRHGTRRDALRPAEMMTFRPVLNHFGLVMGQMVGVHRCQAGAGLLPTL